MGFEQLDSGRRGKNARFLLHVPLWVRGSVWGLVWVSEEGKSDVVEGRGGQWLVAAVCRLSEPSSVSQWIQVPCCSLPRNRFASSFDILYST